MTWFKVDDRLPTSRKLMRIPRDKRAAAIGVWTLAGAWSAHDLTDGWIPAYAVEEWGGDESHAQALVTAGLWSSMERDGEAGYQFHKWDEYQPTKADIEAKREFERERKRQQRRDGDGKFAGQKDVPKVSQWDNRGTPEMSQRSPTVDGWESTVPGPSRPVPSPRATRLPGDFEITDDMKAWASEKVPGLNIAWATEAFIDYWQSATKNAVKKDWAAAWRGWMRRNYEDGKLGPRQAETTPAIPDWMLNG